MALTADKQRKVTRPDLEVARRFQVAATTEIWEGAIVSIDGNGDAIIPDGNSLCVGIARNHYNNALAAATTVHTGVISVGYEQIEEMTLAGASAADVASFVYATDDNTLTLTPNTCAVGRIHSYIGGTTILVQVTLEPYCCVQRPT